MLPLSKVSPARTGVEDFVTRFYRQCLGRQPDAAGLSGWVNALLDGSLTGADVAKNFIFSEEFFNRHTTNELFVTILYSAFFDRDPDEGGYQGWLNYLYGEGSRAQVLNGFVYSTEFALLCERCGINPSDPAAFGTPPTIANVDLYKV